MATSLTQLLRGSTSVSSLAAKLKNSRESCKISKISLHSSIPRNPLSLPWHLNDNESEYESEGEEVEWGNMETFGGADLHSLGEYMLPKHLAGLEKVEKFSQLRFHHVEEVKRLSLAAGLGSRVGSVNTLGVLPHHLGGGNNATERRASY